MKRLKVENTAGMKEGNGEEIDDEASLCKDNN